METRGVSRRPRTRSSENDEWVVVRGWILSGICLAVGLHVPDDHLRRIHSRESKGDETGVQDEDRLLLRNEIFRVQCIGLVLPIEVSASESSTDGQSILQSQTRLNERRVESRASPCRRCLPTDLVRVRTHVFANDLFRSIDDLRRNHLEQMTELLLVVVVARQASEREMESRGERTLLGVLPNEKERVNQRGKQGENLVEMIRLIDSRDPW